MPDVARPSEERQLALLVASAVDYAIFMLDPHGHVLTWNAGAERHQGLHRARDRRPALLRLLHRGGPRPRTTRPRSCELALPRRPLRGGGVARAQGRHALLGERRDHPGLRRGGRPHRVRQGQPRPDRPAACRRSSCAPGPLELEVANRQLVGVPPPRLERARLRDLHARSRRPHPVVERGRRATSRATSPTRSSAGTSRSSTRADGPGPRPSGARARSVAIREGRYEEEGWRVRKDGTRFWASVTITAVRDDDGRLTGFAKVTRDLTDAQGRAGAAPGARGAAARRTRSSTASRSVAAHDMTDPLRTISGFAELLERAELSSPTGSSTTPGTSARAARG